MYCDKCSLILDGSRCPLCGNRTLRPPQAEDLCFLTERDPVWSELLTDVLTKKGIRHLKKAKLGTGMALKTGPLWERFRFYVLYRDLRRAQETVEELFGGRAE